MQLPSRQRGLGLWGWLFVLGTLGFIGMVTLKLIPIYLNEMSIEKIVKAVASDPGSGALSPTDLRRAMQARWDVDDVAVLETKDVRVVKTTAGRALQYEYERKELLFYNISIAVHFQNSFPLRGGGSVE